MQGTFFPVSLCRGREEAAALELLSHPGCAVGIQARLEQSLAPGSVPGEAAARVLLQLPHRPHSSRDLQLQLFLQL